jgi:hypothetical protein
MNQKIIKVAINCHIFDKNIGGNAYYMANEWENVELTTEQFINVVAVDGNAFCAQLDGSRSSKNYKRTNLISLDVDAGTTLHEALNDDFSKKYLTFFYTTASHTVEENRFRLGFLLDRDLEDGSDYTAIKRALGLKYCSDPSTHDPSRISYGNHNAAYQIFEGVIPSDIIDELIEQGRPPAVINKTDSVTGDFNNTIRRSSKKLPRFTEIKTKSGVFTRLVDVTDRTQTHCNFHKDANASAFVNKTPNGSTYMFCMVCQTTWWMQSSSEEQAIQRNESDFLNVVKAARETALKRAEDRIFPADMSPSKYPLAGLPSIEIFNREYLELKVLHTGLTLIRSPKGSGKTESLTEIIRNLITSEDFRTLEDIENTDPDDPPRSFNRNYKILLIGHRQALIRQLCDRLGLNCYLDDKEHSYQEINLRKQRYGVCLDSLWKSVDISYDLVVIDECEQVLAHMLSDTMRQRESIFKALHHVIKSAKNVVALDADLGWTSYLTLTEMRGITTPTRDRKNRVWIKINEFLANGNPIDIYSSKEDLVGQLMSDVAGNKKIFVASNSKRLIEKLHASIENEFGIGKSFAVTSANSRTDEVQFKIMNFKETFDRYNVLLCSPSLGTGIDITFEGNEQVVDCCYGFFESLINTHLDIDQQLRRVRHPKEVRVWISPRKFNFETEFGVVQYQLLSEKILANTFVGFDPVTRSEIYKEDDPFLTLVTHVVSDQRHSQNDLKQNFIEYKTQTGWVPNLVSKNDAYADLGKAFLNIGKQLDDEAFANRILNAKPLNHFEFNIIQEALESDTQVAESSYWSFRRMTLEAFYQKPLTQTIIKDDERGELRTQYKLFNAITDQEYITQVNQHLNQLYKSKGRTIPFDRLKERDAKHALLHTILSSSPVFKMGKFDLNCVYSTSDLENFIKTCRKLRKYIEGQFSIDVRSDIDKKPTSQLHIFLKMAGISTLSDSKKVKGKKIYQYMIDPESHQLMTTLVQTRNSITDDWAFINQLHGFKSIPEFKSPSDGDN